MTRTVDLEGAHVASLRRLGDFRGARVLEVGCGDGRLTASFRHEAAGVLALDPDAAAIDRARAALPVELSDRVSYRAGSPLEVEIPRAAFDIVLFSWSY